jgi:rubredoxin
LSYHYIRQKLLVRPGQRAATQNPKAFAENPDAVNDPDAEVEFHKPLNPHHFRHSRATKLANEFTEAQLCEWFGWVQGSDVPAKYVHLSGRDIDNAYGQLHGFEPEEESEQEPAVRECPRCEELNEPDAAYCQRCGWEFTADHGASESDAAAVEELARVLLTGSREERARVLADAVPKDLADALPDDVREDT